MTPDHITPTGADPILRPYWNSGQLSGLVSGFDGAFSYQELKPQSVSPASDQRMQMNVPTEILLPGVQRQRKRRHAAQMSRVGGEFAERCRHGSEQRLVDQFRGGGNQAMERMRQREHQVKVRHRQHFTPPCGDPGLLRPGLALRAVPVPARVIDVPGRAAAIAGFDVPPER